jgi:hypothetical protein
MNTARLQEIQEIQDMAGKLLTTAGKLSPGPERENVLLKIGTFIAQISVLEGIHDLRPLPLGILPSIQ